MICFCDVTQPSALYYYYLLLLLLLCKAGDKYSSSSMVTLARPPTHSSLKITNRSFRYAAPSLWNELPTDLREPRQTQSPALSPITHGSSSSSPSSLSPLASSLTRSVFHSNSRLGSSANPFLHRPFPFLPD